MILISIVLGLFLEKCCDMGKILRRFNWFSAYLRICSSFLSRCAKITPFLSLLVAVLIPVLIIALIYYPLHHATFGLLGIVLNIFILVYCLGPQSFLSQWKAYQAAATNRDQTAMAQLEGSLGINESNKSESASANANRVAKGLLLQAYYRLFAVLIWFTIFGWAGALIYRLVAESAADHENSPSIGGFVEAAQWVQKVLDWVPVRLASLAFIVAGSFNPAFGVWMRSVLSGLEKNQTILVETGVAALSLKEKEDEPAIVGKETVVLIERSLVIWVVVVALLTIGHLVG
ncbi:MAG: hypothetical protein K0R12_783 [Gammaproteobacteria bacterium]|jgi:membrane protein required for beta-lactamase induction|nr:hypothetical protein [Gammaproteobacteria bacterium]